MGASIGLRRHSRVRRLGYALAFSAALGVAARPAQASFVGITPGVYNGSINSDIANAVAQKLLQLGYTPGTAIWNNTFIGIATRISASATAAALAGGAALGSIPVWISLLIAAAAAAGLTSLTLGNSGYSWTLDSLGRIIGITGDKSYFNGVGAPALTQGGGYYTTSGNGGNYYPSYQPMQASTPGALSYMYAETYYIDLVVKRNVCQGVGGTGGTLTYIGTTCDASTKQSYNVVDNTQQCYGLQDPTKVSTYLNFVCTATNGRTVNFISSFGVAQSGSGAAVSCASGMYNGSSIQPESTNCVNGQTPNGVPNGPYGPPSVSQPVTVAGAAPGIPNSETNDPVPPGAIVPEINKGWKEASSQPGYSGVPWPTTNPVTAPDVTAGRSAGGVTPTVGDLTRPINPTSTVGNPGVTTIAPSNVVPGTTPVVTTQNPDGTTQTTACQPGSSGCLAEVDWGAPAGVQPDDSTLAAPSTTTILAPLLTLFPGLSNWVAPSHSGATCPKVTATFRGHTLDFSSYCQVVESVRPIIGLISDINWTVTALFIILAA